MKVLLLLSALAQVQPGNWELTVVSEMQGQKLGPMSKTQCFSEADARDPGRVLGAGAGCQFSNAGQGAGAYTFDVKCSGLVPMSGRGRIRQDAESFDGELDLIVEAGQNAGGPGGGLTLGIRSKITGRRLGPCKPGT